jgi:parallel beta-helix repeat protein
MGVVELRKIALIMFITLCFAPVLLPSGLEVLGVAPRVITVAKDGSGDYDTIQKAINNATAGEEVTILVRNGTYREHVVVNKSVSLVSENMFAAIVDGSSNGTVFFVNVGGVTIQGFNITNSGRFDSGIYVDRSGGDYINQNTITCTTGITLQFSSGNTISRNSISFNSFVGISLLSSSNNVISNNELSSNGQNGIYLVSSTNNMILDNMISSNTLAGIYLQNSNNNILSGSSLSNNFINGVCLDYSSGNTFYHNNFLVNQNNVEIRQEELVNAWDSAGEGNYWSNYTGHDFNGDGIGDTPYLLSKPAGTPDQDRYPLMGLFSFFTMTFQDRIYNASTTSNSTISSFRLVLGEETANKMIRFTAVGQEGTNGFCRITIPTDLMPSSHKVLIDSQEIIPKLINISDSSKACLYFTYPHKNQPVTILYSEALHLYYEMLARNLRLESDLIALNNSYQLLLGNYDLLLGNLSQTLQLFDALNASYEEVRALSQDLSAAYSILLTNSGILQQSFTQLQANLAALNNSYQNLRSLNSTHFELLHIYSLLVGNYSLLVGNYDQLQLALFDLNASYQRHLQDYSGQAQSFRNLLYILMATTSLFIISTVYLSRRAHLNKHAETKASE